MKKILLLNIFIFLIHSVSAQTTFQQTNTLLNLSVADSDIGDYDDDGDLDLVVMGLLAGSGHFTQIYTNDGAGNFSVSSFAFNDLYRNGQVEFIDYDNDNDLDIFIAGLISTSPNYKSVLYENDGGTFTEIGYNFGGDIINNQFSWSDLDNDGDLDLVLMGDYQAIMSLSYVYRNDGNNNFTNMTHAIEPFSQGKVLIADLDKDGDNDVVCGGLQQNGDFESHLDVYRNDGAFNFVRVARFPGIINGDMELRDYNKDGWLDIIKTGASVTGANPTKIYYNNNLTFTDSGITLASSSNLSTITTGDFSGNGELDILMMLSSVRMYENDGTTLTSNTSIGITGAHGTDVEIGDFDNDHDLDVVIIDSPSSGVFENQTMTPNTIPQSPTVLNEIVNGSDVTLAWDSGTDLESSNVQLTYNIYVGTISEGTDIVTPMSFISDGRRKVVGIGNAGSNKETILKNLPDGLYYWSVQSIDNQYEGSAFAAEQTFRIGQLSVAEAHQKRAFTYYPNAVENELTISAKKLVNEITITSVLGQTIQTTFPNQNEAYIDFSALEKGIYFVSVKIDTKKQTIRILKK